MCRYCISTIFWISSKKAQENQILIIMSSKCFCAILSKKIIVIDTKSISILAAQYPILANDITIKKQIKYLYSWDFLFHWKRTTYFKLISSPHLNQNVPIYMNTWVSLFSGQYSSLWWTGSIYLRQDSVGTMVAL